jgi:hypothetical protein
MIAVLPANLQMALHPELFPSFSRMLLWARIPAQGLLIALVLWCGRSRDPAACVSAGSEPLAYSLLALFSGKNRVIVQAPGKFL